MRKLSERNKELILMGARMSGTMVEGFDYVVEQLYIDEAEELYKFCEWVDNEIGGCASGNIDMLFNAFKNPDDEYAQKQAQVLKKKIEQIKSLI